MKLRNFAFAAVCLAAGLGSIMTSAIAQGPMWDVVHVNMPYTVTINDKTLQPGEYTIQQNRDSGGGSRVLLIYSDNGMKFETSAMTIPTLDPDTARDTKVVLHHLGDNYYFDKIWIQGKDYGYEFPLQESVKSRQKEMADVSLPAKYSTTPAQASTETTAEPAQNQTPQPATATSAEATPPPTTAQVTPSTPAATAPPVDQAASTATQPTTQPDTTSNSANREMNDSQSSTPATMPSTSAGWLMMMLGGGSLSGIGLMLRRKR